MKLLVTGYKGQLGYDVVNEAHSRGIEAVGVDIDEMDITNAQQVNDVIKAHVHSYKVKPIDTVGAGDSFNGALARSLADNKDIISSVKFGNAMGALTTTKRGAIPSLHTLEEVEAFIDSNPEIEVTYL